MGTMPGLGLEGASSIMGEIMSRAGRVLQPAGYNAIHACRPPGEQ